MGEGKDGQVTTETRTVTVGSVAKKKGNTNNRDWVRYSLMDEDDKFVGSTFDKKIGEALDEYAGKSVEVDLDVKQGEKGKLYDLTAVRLAVGGGSNGSAPTPAEKHSTIVREVALKAAVDHAPAGTSVGDVLATADAFVAWINGEKGTNDDSEIPF